MTRIRCALPVLIVCLTICFSAQAQLPCDFLKHRVEGLLESYSFTLGDTTDPMSPVSLGRQFSNRSEYDMLWLGLQIDAAGVNSDSFYQFVRVNDSTEEYVKHDTRGIVLMFEDGTSLSYPNPLVELSSVDDPTDKRDYPATFPVLVGGLILDSSNIQKLTSVRIQSFTLAGHYPHTLAMADGNLLLRAIQCVVAVRPLR